VVTQCSTAPNCTVRCDGGEVLISAHVAPEPSGQSAQCRYTAAGAAECNVAPNGSAYAYCVKAQ
jgi:hypothetical protein